MNKYAVIVAGGKGLRMGQPLPKQFLLLKGLPVLMHTVNAFYKTDEHIDIFVVLPASQISHWEELCAKYTFKAKHKVIPGGETRRDSVNKGLTAINGEGLVAIHDGVRPLVTPQIIDTSYEIAKKEGNAVAAVASKDSLRQRVGNSNHSVSRNEFMLIQTPQTFKLDIIRKAHAQKATEEATDDAVLVENLGIPIHLIEGSYANIKITTPEDLLIAEALLI